MKWTLLVIMLFVFVHCANAASESCSFRGHQTQNGTCVCDEGYFTASFCTQPCCVHQKSKWIAVILTVTSFIPSIFFPFPPFVTFYLDYTELGITLAVLYYILIFCFYAYMEYVITLPISCFPIGDDDINIRILWRTYTLRRVDMTSNYKHIWILNQWMIWNCRITIISNLLFLSVCWLLIGGIIRDKGGAPLQ